MSDANWWDDFSNNLATDLAPFVALFGESPTKQYLSECLTIKDLIIFATAPLGIITAVVSAIRVCGTPSLRAFIGRAQDGAGNAEAELCSSTSRDVCELYSNGGITRVFGRPKLLEIVHDPQPPSEGFYPDDGKEPSHGIYLFKDYIQTDKGKEEWKLQTPQARKKTSIDMNDDGLRSQPAPRFAPNPNLSLNIGIKPRNPFWFSIAATLGIALQASVVIWAYIARYHFKWTRDSVEDRYALPTLSIGTLLLCLGMFSCAYLIERKTEERVYGRAIDGGSTTKEVKAQAASEMYWVQPGNQNIGDQIFESFGYCDKKTLLQRYITSWKSTSESPTGPATIWLAVTMTSMGFILQFLGLRASHSSVAVMQVGVTIIMSVIRSGLRTQRLARNDNFMVDDPDLYQGSELDHLALKLTRAERPMNDASRPDTATTESQSLWMVYHTMTPRQSSSSETNTPVDPPSNRDVLEKDASSVLERLPLPSDNPPILIGFRVRPSVAESGTGLASQEVGGLATAAAAGISTWLSEEYCGRSEAELHRENHHASIKYPRPSAKVFLYRSRLARMTGLENPDSDDSQNWGTGLIQVRNTVRILAEAIEDTMKFFFASDSQAPVVLKDLWETASRIFWTVQCSMGSDESDIQMSLKRAIDDDGEPEGPWMVDRSELEAVLGLWTWSIKKQTKLARRWEARKLDEVDRERAKPVNERIVSTTTSADYPPHEMFDMDMWRSRGSIKMLLRLLAESSHEAAQAAVKQNAVWWKDNGELVTSAERPPPTSHQTRLFGWHNVKLTDKPTGLVVLPSNTSVLLNCAQELYSTFLTAILLAVRSLGGHSKVIQYKGGFAATNENVDKLQNIVITRGLCNDVEAFSCTIPVLRKQGKLELPDHIASEIGDRARNHCQKKEWAMVGILMDWKIGHSTTRMRSTVEAEDPRVHLEATNELRLCIIEACEIFHEASVQEDPASKKFGIDGIINLLQPPSALHFDTTEIHGTPLVWLEHRWVWEMNCNRVCEEGRTLLETIMAYGQAVLWASGPNDDPLSEAKWLEQLLRRNLDGNSPLELQEACAEDIPKAAGEDFDLAPVLHHLKVHRKSNMNIRSLFYSSIKNGWFMVSRNLAKLGADINDGYDVSSPSPLMEATNHGDINTVRTLLKEGAVNSSWTRPGWKINTAFHTAAELGCVIILEDLVRQWPNDPNLNTGIGRESLTPLNLAIKHGRADAVRLLLRPRSTVDAHSSLTKKPALHYAIHQGKDDMVELLLEHDAVNPNYYDDSTDNCPPIIYAVRLGRVSMFNALLRNERVNPSALDCDGRTITWWASALNLASYLEEIIQSGRLYPATMNRRDNHGVTPLGVAIRRGNSDVLPRLIETIGMREGVTYENYDMLATPFLWKLLRIENAKRSSNVLQAIRELLKTDDGRVYSKQLKHIPGLQELWPLVKDRARMDLIEEPEVKNEPVDWGKEESLVDYGWPKNVLEGWAKVGEEGARWAYQLDDLKVLEGWSSRSSSVTTENDLELELRRFYANMQVRCPQGLP